MDAEIEERFAELEGKIAILESHLKEAANDAAYNLELNAAMQRTELDIKAKEAKERDDQVKKIADLEFSISFLEKKFVELDVKIDLKAESVLVALDKAEELIHQGDNREREALRQFMKNHLHYHVELDDQVGRAFFKTHPEIVEAMSKVRSIVGIPVDPRGEKEDPHEFIERIFAKDWDGSPTPKK
jgi:hypothetical protein